MPQIGHYSNADLRYVIEHDGTELLELNDFSHDIDVPVEAAGAGLGIQKNTYYKTVGPPKGTFKINRNKFARLDKGNLFLDLARGSSVIMQENIAAAATTYTVVLNTALVTVLEVRDTLSNTVYREGLDYSVNYTTGVITLAQVVATAGLLTVRYIASSRRLQQFVVNGGFEDVITGTWIGATGTSTVARSSVAANVYAENYGLAVTPTVITTDGVQYNLPIIFQPGRTYRLVFMAKAAAAEVMIASWYDGSVQQSMTAVSGQTLSTTYGTPVIFTFVPTKSIITNFQIRDSKASPAIFYIDNVTITDDTTTTNPNIGNNPMDDGLAVAPFTFNIIERRVLDGVTTRKFMRCALDKVSEKSGKEYKEDISGNFLDLITE
jgi:hypothetical protein